MTHPFDHGHGTWCVPCQNIDKERDKLIKQLEKSEANQDVLRWALEQEVVEVSPQRTWCRRCRTENRAPDRTRASHPHAFGCALAPYPEETPHPTSSPSTSRPPSHGGDGEGEKK